MLDTAETVSTSSPSQPASTWPAHLSLEFVHNARGTRLMRCRHQGPLYVQKPFYPEGADLAHAYVLHPPGGMVSGDELKIAVDATVGARVLLTTPGAGRVYRARGDQLLQHQHIELNVAEGASIEWLPLEGIAYPGANARLDVDVHIADGGAFVGWDVLSLGLPAAAEIFDRGRIQQRFRLFHRDQLALVEHLRVDGEAFLQSVTGLRGQPISGFYVAGPFAEMDEECLAGVRASCQGVWKANQTLAGASVVGSFLVVRYLGSSSAQARELFTECWQHVRPRLLGREACCPRIWST